MTPHPGLALLRGVNVGGHGRLPMSGDVTGTTAGVVATVEATSR